MTKRSVSGRLVSCLVSPKLSLNFLCLLVTVFVLLQLWSFHINLQPILLTPSLFTYLKQQEPELENKTAYLTEKLRESITFLPLKDLRFSNKPLEGHTWFMSSLYDNQTEGEIQYQEFPSESSKGKLLCLKGVDEHDGSWNHYALAWPQALPVNATLQEGLTFVSYNHYDYGNMWHGLSAIVPFVAWSLRNNCEKPQRWVLYHWGELRFKMGNWLSEIITAVYGQSPEFFRFSDGENPVCFKKVVVMRHNEGGMSRERRMEVFDLIRCKVRNYCNSRLSETPKPRIGVGQFVYQWGANWSGMKHEGSWRDPVGETCRFLDSDRRCMSVYKNGKIGYNESYFGDWARSVLDRFKVRKMEDVVERNHSFGSLDYKCLC